MWQRTLQQLAAPSPDSTGTAARIPTLLVRFEDLCLRPAATMARVLAFTDGTPRSAEALNAAIAASCPRGALPRQFGVNLPYLSRRYFSMIVEGTRAATAALGYTALVEEYARRRAAMGPAKAWPDLLPSPRSDVGPDVEPPPVGLVKQDLSRLHLQVRVTSPLGLRVAYPSQCQSCLTFESTTSTVTMLSSRQQHWHWQS